MLDEIVITATAGRGGNGIVSFRREKYLPRGGPDGGTGGKGGDVVLEATTSLVTLDSLRRKRTVEGEDGASGGSARKHGRNGRDVVVKLPIGTLVWAASEERQLADLTVPGQRVVIAEGGLGGGATHRSRRPRAARHASPRRDCPANGYGSGWSYGSSQRSASSDCPTPVSRRCCEQSLPRDRRSARIPSPRWSHTWASWSGNTRPSSGLTSRA